MSPNMAKYYICLILALVVVKTIAKEDGVTDKGLRDTIYRRSVDKRVRTCTEYKIIHATKTYSEAVEICEALPGGKLISLKTSLKHGLVSLAADPEYWVCKCGTEQAEDDCPCLNVEMNDVITTPCNTKKAFVCQWDGGLGATAPCAFLPCLNDGVCTDIDTNEYTCECLTGTSGVNCEIVEEITEPPMTDYCADKPCQNGGTCVDDVSSYHCDCIQGYDGQHCEICTGPVSDVNGEFLLSSMPLSDDPTILDGLVCMQTMVIGSDTFLLTSSISLKTCKLFKYDTASGFRLHQDICSQLGIGSPWGLKAFEIDGVTYLAVAQNKDSDGYFETDSYLLKWDGNQFKTSAPHQLLASNAARHFTYSSVSTPDHGTKHFLVLTNYESDSQVFMWNEESQLFVPQNNFPTDSASQSDWFQFDGDNYLVFSGTVGNAKVYRLDPAVLTFIEHSTVPNTTPSLTVDTYLYDCKLYMVTSKPTQFSIPVIYEWGPSGFQPIQSSLAPNLGHIRVFEINNHPFLFRSCMLGDSKLYKPSINGLVEVDTLPASSVCLIYKCSSGINVILGPGVGSIYTWDSAP